MDAKNLKHNPLEVTDEQRANLVTLAKGLLTVDVPGVEFDMSRFESFGNPEEAVFCGTVGCALGWAPFFGIQKSRQDSHVLRPTIGKTIRYRIFHAVSP